MGKALGAWIQASFQWAYDKAVEYFNAVLVTLKEYFNSIWALVSPLVLAALYAITQMVDEILAALIGYATDFFGEYEVLQLDIVKTPTWFVEATSDVIPWTELIGLSVSYFAAVSGVYLLRTLIKLVPTIG